MRDEKEQLEYLQSQGYSKVYIWDAEPNEEDSDHTHPFDTHLAVDTGILLNRLYPVGSPNGQRPPIPIAGGGRKIWLGGPWRIVIVATIGARAGRRIASSLSSHIQGSSDMDFRLSFKKKLKSRLEVN